jgi:hypothetical protein
LLDESALFIIKNWKDTKDQWAYYAREKEYILMQISTTGINENWHKVLKRILGLSKNTNSGYAIHGVVETVELCAIRQDRADEEVYSLENLKMALCGRYPWLKLFPIMAQKLLQKQLQISWKRYKDKAKTREFTILILDEDNECYCKDFYR